MDALVAPIGDLKAARAAGRNDAEWSLMACPSVAQRVPLADDQKTHRVCIVLG